ncbi:hypothetical protein IFM46972_03961 [Aspergillus udagawae]|uniref:Uncharacterized protein n=1 Tax=Aspergillus udagawae TaxID=91492 RepID=A0A8H3NGD3_9EURO|nr:hypothetical protein IFM46972_03961 [Aspergillus udagawae]
MRVGGLNVQFSAEDGLTADVWEIRTPQEVHLQPLQSLEQLQVLQEQGVILIELVVKEGLLEEDKL